MRALVLGILFLLAPGRADGQEGRGEPLAIAFWDVTPSLFAVPGERVPQGWLADLTTRILQAAGYEPVWYGPMGTGRILEEVSLPQVICVPNWVARQDRAAFKFTGPIQRNGAVHLVWVRAPGDWVRQYRTAEELLRDVGRTGVFVRGSSASAVALEPSLREAEMRGHIRAVNGGPVARLRLVGTGQADYTFAPADILQRSDGKLGLPKGTLVGYPMPDLGSENLGRIMCSAATPDTVIARLNRGIEQFHARQNRAAQR